MRKIEFGFIFSLLISRCFAWTQLGGGDHEGANWPADSTGPIAGTHYNIDTFRIRAGDTLYIQAYNGTEYGGVRIIANRIIIEGTLSADGRGYPASEGPGAGEEGIEYNSAGGGGYGGSGGDGENGYGGGSAYGDSAFGNGGTYDWEMGSGGGNGSTSYPGGAGGGRIALICTTGTKIITIDGTVSANGEIGSANNYYAGGGGSGGSIWIICDSIEGNGVISCDGGDGGDGGYVDGGGGAGGRIHIRYRTANFSGRISVSGGRSVRDGGNDPTHGQQGSIWIEPTISGNVELSLSPVDTSIGSHHSGTAFILANFTQNYVIVDTIIGNLNIIAKDSIIIGQEALISADYKGYDASEGSGGGGDGGLGYGGGGAGYGGEGGDGQSGNAGGAAYSDSSEPYDLGSGGGHGYDSYSYPGGAGGGKIRLECTSGVVRINGTVSANGEPGEVGNVPDAEYAGGGGSGGSIWIICDLIEGNGVISCDGGNGGDGDGEDGGGGGGGRIHIRYRSSNFIGRISVSGGSGPDWATDGQQGSILVEQSDGGVKILVWPVNDTIGSHSSFSLAMIDSVEIRDKWVRLSQGDSIIGNTYIITQDSIIIEEEALISADYKGYAPNEGPGAGWNGGIYYGAGGGGYGGRGGDGEEGIFGGDVYDGGSTEFCDPQRLGSGGGHGYDSYYCPGGAGGGRIKLECTSGVVRINGTLSANGEAGTINATNSTYPAGGGSGGSIWIQAYRIEGEGKLSANGGDGGNSTYEGGGGGGGGRIALISASTGSITYDTSEATVNGGEGYVDADDGEVGTFAWSKSAEGSWRGCPYETKCIHFNAISGNNCIILEWKTEEESDIYKWIIMRKENIEWRKITEVPAKGSFSKYFYIDSLISINTWYHYKLGKVDLDGRISWYGPIKAKAKGVKYLFYLRPPIPNPFKKETKISYGVPGWSYEEPLVVNLSVYDISGRLVKEIVNKKQPPGRYEVCWDGKDEQGNKISNSIYFYRLKVGTKLLIRKIVHIQL